MSVDVEVRPSPTVFQRRQARRLSYVNGGLWAIGNGLTSSTLIVYLALQLGAPGLGLGVGGILAAPRVAGLLRLFTPALIARVGDRKRFCLVAYLLSALVLVGLPAAAAPGWLGSPKVSLAALVLFWCMYHLLEFFGNVALYAWLADLVPLTIRGRFFGRRQRWMLAGQASAMVAAGLFSSLWQIHHPLAPRWVSYAIPAVLGAAFMLAALGPLAVMPEPSARRPLPQRIPLADLIAPLMDFRFVRFLAFGCWFSFFNGITQSVQVSYPGRVLGLDLAAMLTMQTGMRLGQLAVSPRLGRVADRWGNKPLMMACLPLVASGLLFYFLATPQAPWWIVGAWVLWIAYAGINVGQPNLMLKLAPPATNAAYVAAFQAISDLCVAASTLAGGWLYDRLLHETVAAGPWTLDFYQAAFLFGAVARLGGVAVLGFVDETPPAEHP